MTIEVEEINLFDVSKVDRLIREFKNREFLIQPKDVADKALSDRFLRSIRTYEEEHNLFTKHRLSKDVLEKYTALLAHGMIVSSTSDRRQISELKTKHSQEIEKKNNEIIELKIKIARLQGQLEERQKHEIPDDVLDGDVDKP